MKLLKFLLVVTLFFCLILVRRYEYLFYDPFLDYFHGDFRHREYPEYDSVKLMLHIFYRYALNVILSLGIIYFIFLKMKYVKISLIIFSILFAVLSILYYYFIETQFSLGFTAGFYVRRFLIQPIFLLLLLPAFWYIERKENVNLNN